MATKSKFLRRDQSIARLTSLQSAILTERHKPGSSFWGQLSGIVQKEFNYKILPDSSGPHLAVVLKVLNDPYTLGYGDTKCLPAEYYTNLNSDVMLSDAVFEERMRTASRNPTRVIAKVIGYDDDLPYPAGTDDLGLIAAHGEFWGATKSEDLKNLQVDQLIMVTFSNLESKSSPLSGQRAGLITGVLNPEIVGRIEKAAELAGIALDRECPPPAYIDTGPKYLVAETYSRVEVREPKFKFIKSRIKTGLYGDGSPQTKAHFTQMLKKSAQSSVYEIAGPAPGPEGAFIWVGHLKNNGFLDLLDRPISPGRETIIYASKMLDITAPIEIKYYLHDNSGFGNAWVAGPGALPSDAEIAMPNNDFRTKIAPAIKDLIRDKRNLVIVIPEMMYSMGFGTAADDHMRIRDTGVVGQGYAGGQHIDIGVSDRPGDVMTPIMRAHPKLSSAKVRDAINEYLNKIPVKTDQGLLGVTRLTGREYSTFDGSYTGGDFNTMHNEVLEVLQGHLGISWESIDYVSVIADGLGAVTLSALAQSVPTNAVHKEAERSFRNAPIDRFDFIDRAVDDSTYYFFRNFLQPPIVFFQDYLDPISLSNPTKNIIFNYHTLGSERQGSAARKFFTHSSALMGLENANITMASAAAVFNSSFGPSVGNHGEKKFTHRVTDRQNLLVSLHVASSTDKDKADKLVGHAFQYVDTEVEQARLRNISAYDQIPFDAMPNHAAAISKKIGSAGAAQMQIDLVKLKEQIDYFSGALASIAASGAPSALCDEDLYRSYCKNGMLYIGSDGDFHREYKTWWSNLRKTVNLTRLIEFEVTPYPNGISNVADLQTAKSFLESKKIDYLQRKANLEDPAGYAWLDYEGSAKEAWADLSTNFNLNLLVDADLFKSNFGSNMPSDPPGQGDGDYSFLVHAMAQLDSLEMEIATIERRIKDLEASGAPQKPPDCVEVPAPMAELPIKAPDGVSVGTAPTTLCGNIKIKNAFTTYADFYQFVPYAARKNSFAFSADVATETKLDDIPEFEISKFRHAVRGKNNSKRTIKGPAVWKCMSDRISKAWDMACKQSNYYPFAVTDGLKGSNIGTRPGGQQGSIAYKNLGLSPFALGLGIGVDPILCPRHKDEQMAHSIWTGAWTPWIAGNPEVAKKLYDMGLYSNTVDESAGNCWYNYNAREALEIDHLVDIRHAPKDFRQYRSAIATDNIIRKASGSPIVPADVYPLPNPTKWAIIFCENSGMKWSNSFFMKKRFTGGEWKKYNWAPHNTQLSSIFDVPDIVSRIQDISWRQTKGQDAHSIFMFWDSENYWNFITWDDIEASIVSGPQGPSAPAGPVPGSPEWMEDSDGIDL